jgi:UDP-N-acetylmuramoyl-L-alanyl-D-glutamate--2,6-diaminopimelate ligase
MTRLSELERELGGSRRLGAADPEVRGIAYDSRRVQPGDLFVCVRGFKNDGLQYLPDALRRGATAALLEAPSALAGNEMLGGVPALLVTSAREAMARAATAFYGHPSRRLMLVGVTGTNGKTTTTYLIESICRAAGMKTGVIGTIGCRLGHEALPAEHTTPEAPDLQCMLSQMADAGVACAAMEVSSHALALCRTLGCEFDVGVFTNLTQDHLDFHPDIEDYFRAKARLFTEYPRQSRKSFAAVINVDDPFGRRLAAETEGRVFSCGLDVGAEICAHHVEASAGGLSFHVEAEGETRRVRLPLGGQFNVYNSLAAIGTARALGIGWEAVLEGLASATGVPGRFESVVAADGQDFAVIVDYAHTPDGLENVLRSARALSPRRLSVVFGCGGDRDRRKRPLMGEIAARLADQVFVTSDNPRTEEPGAVIADIVSGIGSATPDRLTVEPDRRAAICAAVASAGPGDLVVIAGKGHETYQIVADRTIHFDDRDAAREAILARGEGVPLASVHESSDV